MTISNWAILSKILSKNSDILFRSSQELIVIEAKKGDLDRGFNQLAAEMIAMDIYEEEQADLTRVYGAITIGEVWRFAVLEREAKQLRRIFTPSDSRKIFQIFFQL